MTNLPVSRLDRMGMKTEKGGDIAGPMESL